VEDDLKKHLDEYMDGSCSWLHESPQFLSWVSVDTSPQPIVLAIEGRPGSGKSTVAAYIVNNLRREKQNVIFFFIKANHAEKESIVGLLRTIISQLLRIDHHSYDIIEPYYQESGRAIADSLIELQRGVLSIMKKFSRGPLFLVLDAIDESSDKRETLDWLSSIGSFSSDLRILFTTRPPSTFSLNSVASYSVLTLDNIEKVSIDRYIKERVERNPILRNSKLGQEVATSVSKAANGLWLYARLMMDDIDRSPSDGQVLKQMNTLPRGFTELYTRILKTNETSFTPIELKLAQQLYLWLDVADYMPRFLGGINESLGFPILKLIFQYANDGEPVFDPILTAQRFSGSLIEVSRNPHSDASETTYDVDFIHATAEQYLDESNRLSASQLPLTLRPRRHRHLHRAMTAIWYYTKCQQSQRSLLQMRTDQSADIWSLEAYFEMAYGLWNALHLIDLDVSDDAQEVAEVAYMLKKLSEFISSRACLRWIETAIIINYENRYPNLLWNAIRGWESGRAAKSHTFEPYAAFSRARIRFCRNYAYVLTMTGVGGGDTPVELILQARRKFENDILAREIMKLGRRWRRLIFPTPELSGS
jgi:hypothetical protein